MEKNREPIPDNLKFTLQVSHTELHAIYNALQSYCLMLEEQPAHYAGREEMIRLFKSLNYSLMKQELKQVQEFRNLTE